MMWIASSWPRVVMRPTLAPFFWNALREILRRGRDFGGEELARAIDEGAVGEGAADVDADKIRHGRYISRGSP